MTATRSTDRRDPAAEEDQSAGSPSSRRSRLGKSGKKPFSPRVLLAEDDDDMRELLAWTLREEGCKVTEASDGKELSRFLEGAVSGESGEDFDLVVSDIRMPGQDGLSAIRSLTGRSEALPIILITAFGDESLHRQCEMQGLPLLDKPFEMDELVAVVRRQLGWKPGGIQNDNGVSA